MVALTPAMKSFLPWFQFPSFDFELYRRSLVGQALLDSLAEIDDFISEEQAYDIVRQFDFSNLKVAVLDF